MIGVFILILLKTLISLSLLSAFIINNNEYQFLTVISLRFLRLMTETQSSLFLRYKYFEAYLHLGLTFKEGL